MSLSNVILVGNLGRDPETRYTPTGKMNVRFTMATNRTWSDQQGQKQERTTWFNVTAWGKLAETIDNFSQQGVIRKGTQLYVFGRFESREYQDQQGQTRMSLDVTASEIQLLGGRADGDASAGGRRDFQESPAGDSGAFEPQDIDDIPF